MPFLIAVDPPEGFRPRMPVKGLRNKYGPSVSRCQRFQGWANLAGSSLERIVHAQIVS